MRRRVRTFTNLWHPNPAEVYERWYAAFPRSLKRQLCRSALHESIGRTIDTESWMAQTLAKLSHTDPVAGAAAF